MWCSSWDWLPDVHYCCGCIGLRCGSIIIAIFSIFFGGPAAVLYFVFACSTHIVVTILFYFLLVLCVIHVIMALIFLIGICADFPITGEMFIWSIIATNGLAAIILLLAGCIGVPGCLIMFLIGLIVLLVNFIIAAYFIIVINSYKNTDM